MKRLDLDSETLKSDTLNQKFRILRFLESCDPCDSLALEDSLLGHAQIGLKLNRNLID